MAPRREAGRLMLAATLAGAALRGGATLVAAQTDAEAITAQRAEMAREFTDPLTTVPQVFTQDAYTPTNYGTDAPANRVIARALLPRLPRLSFFPEQLVRPTIQLVTVPTGRGSETRTEFGDVQLFDVARIPWLARDTGLLIGVGPTFTFPTATHKLAGQGAWQAGPTFAAIYKGLPGVLVGTLVENPISFAYTSDDRQPLNTLLVQPLALLYVGEGFYVKSADSTWTVNWHHHTLTTLPLSFGIGYVMLRGSGPPLNLFVSGEWMAYRQFAPVAPQTTVRFGVTVPFPQWRLWD